MLRQTENAFRFFCYVDCLYGKNDRRGADSSTTGRTLFHRRKPDGIRRKIFKNKKRPLLRCVSSAD